MKGLSKLGSGRQTGGQVVPRGSMWADRGSLGRWGNCPGTGSNLPLLLDQWWPVPGMPPPVSAAAAAAAVAAASCWGRPHGLLTPSNPPRGLPCHCCYNPRHHDPCVNECSGRWGLGVSCSELHTLQQTQPTVQGQDWPNTNDLQSALIIETRQQQQQKNEGGNTNLEVLLSQMWCNDITRQTKPTMCSLSTNCLDLLHTLAFFKPGKFCICNCILCVQWERKPDTTIQT
jgi:hypothetical protein